MENKTIFTNKWFSIQQNGWLIVLPSIIWFGGEEKALAFEFLYWSFTIHFKGIEEF